MTNGERTLPLGWRLVRLGDVCSILNGFAFDSELFTNKDGIPLIRIRDLKTNAPSTYYRGSFAVTYLVPAGSLLVGMDGEFRCYIWKGLPSLLNQRVCRLLPNSSELDDHFLYYAINDFLSEIEDKTGYTTVKHISSKQILDIQFALPSIDEQRYIAAMLNEQMAAVEKARAAAQAQLEAADHLIEAYIRDSLSRGVLQRLPLGDVLIEVVAGVGDRWKNYPVIGATRDGLAPAKEKVGKNPGRYKLADTGTVFYNPMRINIGSIAMVDDDDEPGITSPDYVVVKGKLGMVHPRWFYYWFRSSYGEAFIKNFARGAVRERLMFTRLKPGQADLPSWDVQNEIAEKLKAVSVLKQRVTNQLADIEQLPGALLRRAFSGGI